MVESRRIVCQNHERLITEETEQENQNDNDSDDNDDNFPKGGKAPTKQLDADSESEQPKNKSKLIMDATCAPADIAYPTDLGLLNEDVKNWNTSLMYCMNRTWKKEKASYLPSKSKKGLFICCQAKEAKR